MAMHSGGTGRAMADINVTPMVDVMLVLLIIFMVTAPLITQGVPVALPQTQAPTMDVKENRMVLTLTHEQKIYIGEVELPYAELKQKLLENIKLREDKEVYLHADRNLSYGFVVDVMAIMKEAGVENLGMVTDPVSSTSGH